MPPPPPPPGGGDATAPQAPTNPPAVATAPAQPSPATDAVTRMVMDAISLHRSIAKAVPQVSGYIQQINDLMRKVQAGIMENAKPGEPAAPPT